MKAIRFSSYSVSYYILQLRSNSINDVRTIRAAHACYSGYKNVESELRERRRTNVMEVI